MSQASLATLSRELGVNPKTVAKWRKRATVEDLKTGPKAPHSTTLSQAGEAMVVAFRRHTLLPLDDCLYALQPSIPHLTRSALHRCIQRHGISRLPDVEGDKPERQRFKRYPIGFFHIDIAEVQTAEGKLYLFVGIDRTGKFAVTQLVDKADRRTAWEFLGYLLKAVPYRIHTILRDNVLGREAMARFGQQISRTRYAPRWKARTLSTGSLSRPHGTCREGSFHLASDRSTNGRYSVPVLTTA
ncbi:MAG: transposase [Novosphingobium lindaniclasticum]|nr:transposase [Novosphingobium lindaniclasticum]